MDRQAELERFKHDIPLAQFAAGEFGYLVVPTKTSPQSVYMRQPDTGSKISIFRNQSSGDWLFKSYTDPRDAGTVLDLVQHRTGENLGLVRKRLRPWLNGVSFSPRPVPADVPRDVLPTRSDVLEVREFFERSVRPILNGEHRYLNENRGLAAAKLAALPFAGRIHTDPRGNALFVHRDASGVSGWESRNTEWKAFSKAGYKSLWYATPAAGYETRKLVFAESGIDAVSYALLHPDPHACYLSTSGQISMDIQSPLIASAMNKLPHDGRIVIAADNDNGGEVFTERFLTALQQTGREDLHFLAHAPTDGDAKDWNDVLKQRSPPPMSTEFDFTN